MSVKRGPDTCGMTDANPDGKMRIEKCRIKNNLHSVVYNNILDTSILLKHVFFVYGSVVFKSRL